MLKQHTAAREAFSYVIFAGIAPKLLRGIDLFRLLAVDEKLCAASGGKEKGTLASLESF